MTIVLDFNDYINQNLNFIADLNEDVVTSQEIEFVHDQSNTTLSDIFTNISTNDRLITFEFTTGFAFVYPGWYTYNRYENNTGRALIDKGKFLLEDSKNITTYSVENNEKIIYKG